MSPETGRILLVLALLLGLLGLCVSLGSLGPVPALGDYPDGDELSADADRYLGTEVDVVGYVVGTDPVVIDLDVDRPGGRFTVIGLAVDAEPGDNLWVFGVVGPDRTIRSIDAFTVPRRGVYYTFGISFLAGLWTLGRLCRGWRLTPGWTLARREEPLPLRRLLAGGDDA